MVEELLDLLTKSNILKIALKGEPSKFIVVKLANSAFSYFEGSLDAPGKDENDFFHVALPVGFLRFFPEAGRGDQWAVDTKADVTTITAARLTLTD